MSQTIKPVNPYALTSPTKDSFLTILDNKNTKKAINNWANWGTASINALTFLSGNFNILDSFQEILEKSCEVLTKIAYSVTSLACASDLWKKKNPISFLGMASTTLFTILSNHYNLWLAYGISYGLGNFVIITDQREIVNKDGEPILDKDGNVQLINGDFSTRGWKEGLLTTFRETGKIVKELINKPQRIKKISHALCTSSIFEMFGPIISYFFGLEKLGSFIRSTGTIATQTAFLLHNDSSKKTSAEDHGKITLKSSIALGGVLGIAGSAVDFLKRLSFISDKFANLTNLSIALDRGMAALILSGIMDIKKEKNS